MAATELAPPEMGVRREDGNQKASNETGKNEIGKDCKRNAFVV